MSFSEGGPIPRRSVSPKSAAIAEHCSATGSDSSGANKKLAQKTQKESVRKETPASDILLGSRRLCKYPGNFWQSLSLSLILDFVSAQLGREG